MATEEQLVLPVNSPELVSVMQDFHESVDKITVNRQNLSVSGGESDHGRFRYLTYHQAGSDASHHLEVYEYLPKLESRQVDSPQQILMRVEAKDRRRLGDSKLLRTEGYKLLAKLQPREDSDEAPEAQADQAIFRIVHEQVSRRRRGDEDIRYEYKESNEQDRPIFDIFDLEKHLGLAYDLVEVTLNPGDHPDSRLST